MASLVQFLVSGVNGAENGTATFVLRATASSAATVLYNELEETSQPGTNIITLDSHGAAEIYCDAYCDVTLKTSAGATLRTVTIGHAATMVEVQSDSFTGTGYTGSPTASGQPITLAAVLDKWDNSAGADDWKVAVNGVATNLSSAFSALAGLFFNVKDPIYGAAGDGTTDDTTAIGLAITAAAAAGGGIVFFPPSTSFYKFTTLTISSDNITLMGTGPIASTLRSSSTSTLITISTTSQKWTRLIGLSVTGTGASANPIVQIGAGAHLLIDNCEFTGSSFTGSYIRKTSGSTSTLVNIRSSKFFVGALALTCLNNGASDNICFTTVTDCRFTVADAFIGLIIAGPNFSITNCVFDASAVVSGAGFYAAVNPASNSTAGKYLGSVSNSTFLDGGFAGSTAFYLPSIATDSNFTESNNSFIGFAATTALTTTGGAYVVSHSTDTVSKVYLGSRNGRSVSVTQSGTGTVSMGAFTNFECVYVNYTGAGNITLQAPIATLTAGSECCLVLLNNSGSQRDVVIDYGETPRTYGPQAATSGSDLTLQPNDAERVVVWFKAMPHSSGSPLVFAPVPVED